jgi:glycine cleavage system H protein
MEFPEKLKYSKSHEWIDVSPDAATCGISDYAQKEITDVVFVEVPPAGKKVKKGDAIAVVESVKAAFDIYAPLSGEIVDSNKDLESDPAIINEDPYGKGWLFKIKLDDSSEVSQLMDSAAYQKHIEEGSN